MQFSFLRFALSFVFIFSLWHWYFYATWKNNLLYHIPAAILLTSTIYYKLCFLGPLVKKKCRKMHMNENYDNFFDNIVYLKLLPIIYFEHK